MPESESRPPQKAAPDESSAKKTEADSTDSPAVRPYADGLVPYLKAGWQVVLPVTGKGETPKGFTGYRGPLKVDRSRYDDWLKTRGDLNLTLRLPLDMVGLDVDAYKPEHPLSEEAQVWLKSLPPTFRSSSRLTSPEYDGYSGIRLYRLPRSMVHLAEEDGWYTSVHTVIDLIRFAHRQVVSWPSVHHSGATYRWFNETTGKLLDEGSVPYPDNIPTLSEADAMLLRKPPAEVKKRAHATVIDMGKKPERNVTDETSGGWAPLAGDWCPAFQKTLDHVVEAVNDGAGRHDSIVLKAMLKTVRLTEQGHNGGDEALDALHGLFVAEVGEGREAEWYRALEGATAAVESEPTAEEDKGCCGKDDEKKKRAGLAGVIVHRVEDNYVIHRSPDGELYAVPKVGPRIPIRLGQSGGRLRHAVTRDWYDETGYVPQTKHMDEAMRVILARGWSLETTTELHLRCARVPDGLVIDLAHDGSGACVHITAAGWTVLDNPPEGILFRRSGATRSLPVPVRCEPTEGAALLCGLLKFEGDPERFMLCAGWLVAACFPDIARPMLLLLGPPGVAKSTRGQTLASVLDPRDELGSNFGKNLDDDRVKAMNRYLIGYDNLGKVSESTSDHLCRLVTGDESDKRMLYTDGDLITMSYRRTGILTAISVPSVRPDAMERMIPIHLDSIPEEQRASELDIRARFDEAHPKVLSWLFDGVSAALKKLPKTRTEDRRRARMADYDDVLASLSPKMIEAYHAVIADAMREVAEDDPFVTAIVAWLKDAKGTFEGTPTDALAAASGRRSTGSWGSMTSWWPQSPRAFTTALDGNAGPLRAMGVTVSRKRVHGARVLVVRLDPVF